MVVVRTIRGALCAAALLLLGRPAHAQSGSEASEPESPRYRLLYTAPAGCPDRAAFATGISARTSRPRLVEDDDPGAAIVLRVAIASSGNESASGRLDLREPDGTEETRSVASRTCGEVANALALVAAVLLDPDARVSPEPALPPPPPPGPATTPVAPVPTSSAANPKPPPRSEPPPASLPREWRFSGGAGLGGLGGVGPAFAPMAGVFDDVERAAAGALTSTVRLNVDVASTSSDLRSGTQTYEWLGATLRLCPAYLTLPGRLRLAPCGALQTGVHRGTTRDVHKPSTNVGVWLAPVAAGTLAWEMSSSVALEINGGVLFPLRRSRFFLAPDSTIFDVPVAAGMVGLGARIRFL